MSSNLQLKMLWCHRHQSIFSCRFDPDFGCYTVVFIRGNIFTLPASKPLYSCSNIAAIWLCVSHVTLGWKPVEYYHNDDSWNLYIYYWSTLWFCDMLDKGLCLQITIITWKFWICSQWFLLIVKFSMTRLCWNEFRPRLSLCWACLTRTWWSILIIADIVAPNRSQAISWVATMMTRLRLYCSMCHLMHIHVSH